MTSVCYRFGEFRLHPATRELSRNGERIALAPKSFECLAYLVACRERAVGRDELISAVWGRAEVSDALLAQTLWRARRVIGDTGREQAALRTVARFGYQWVAPVVAEEVAGDPDAGDPSVEPPIVPVSHVRRHALVAAVASFCLALVTWGIVALRVPAPALEPGVQGLVVVLPVEVSTADTENGWLRLGAMEYIASHLRDGAHLNVMPSEQVVALLRDHPSRTPDDLRRLAETAGADKVLAPRMARSSSAWTIDIDVYRDGRLNSLEAHADRPLQAAGLGSERFLRGLGIAADASPGEGDRLQRIDAAMLAGDLVQARELAEAASPLEKQDPALAIRSARVAFRAGRTDEAERTFQSIDVPAVAPDAPERIEAELGLGAVALRRHAYADAERVYSQILEHIDDRGPTRLLARAYVERGIANGSLDRYAAAMDDFGHARVELNRLGDRLGLAALDTNVAIVASDRGRWTDALGAYDRAIEVFDRFGVRDSLVITLANKVGAELAMLDSPASLKDSARAWDLGKDLENRIVVDLVATRRIDALIAAGQLAAAEHLIDRFIDAPDADPDFMLKRASLLVEEGRAGEALALADGILDRIEHAPAEAICLGTISTAAVVLVDAAALAGRKDQAAGLLSRVRAARPPSGDVDRAFAFQLANAEVQAARNDIHASDGFIAALASADQSARPESIVMAGVAYARFLVAHPDRDRAAALIGRLAPYLPIDYRAARATAALYAVLGERALAEAADDTARSLAGERMPLAAL